MNQEPRGIDPMDEPGEYRDKVRQGVAKRVGMVGQPLAKRDELFGSWEVAVDTSFGKSPPQPLGIYHLEGDGSCVIETTVAGGTVRNTGKWELNDDGTFKLLIDCAPDPDIPGLEDGAADESRFFVLALPEGGASFGMATVACFCYFPVCAHPASGNNGLL
jgi:hypothetical protein